ncbi:hypothetical protein PL263_12885 [Methylomonas sp. EFPC3]|uniref:hypothetical protein n=1 Tax=Methylomonas sp. EFPC3 TaxID=3021710 RepID=UPI002417DF82|nr:hypothetical protein [Methylomonas sp. EFPC3]WFP49001.1 hypothetical protein PL263_12885 [Methylomonas sp. EFPC3]
MADVTYTFDFEKYHVYKVLANESLKEIVAKGIKKASLRQSAHSRGGKNTLLVMNAAQEQQLHEYIRKNKLFGDGVWVPVYGCIVIGYSDGKKGIVYTGGTVELNIKKEKSSGNQPPTYVLSHCGGISEDATYVGTTAYAKWETTWGNTSISA